jgi:acyl carrier protein phosphodiesterase
MADGIRGNQFDSYPDEVQKKILHRAIDNFY